MADLNKELRPLTFEEVVGQSTVKVLLENALAQDRLPRLCLFQGPSGTGKSTLAEITASVIADDHQIKKINMGALTGKQDLLEVIREVFTLQAADGNNVFILEEVHALTKDQQIPFLEEIERQQDRVFIFMCTTEPMRLIPELRNRATVFRLERPSIEDCIRLVQRACLQLDMTPPKDKTIKWLIKRVGCVPRELIKTVDILSVVGTMNEDTISRYLGVVNTTDLIELLALTTNEDFHPLHNELHEGKHSPLEYLTGMKELFIEIMDYLLGGNKQAFTIVEKRILNTVFESKSTQDILSIAHYIGDLTADTNVDAYYKLIKLHRILNKRTERIDVAKSKQEAVVSEIKSEQATQDNQVRQIQEEEELSLEMIQNITGSSEVYK